MTTIRELAAELRTSEDTIRTYVTQLIDIDGEDAIVADTSPLTTATGRVLGTEVTLTAGGEQGVRDALAAADETEWDEPILSEIHDAATELARLESEFAARRATVVEKRDGLIRQAMARDVKRARIAEAAGFKGEARLYQIRDGRN